MGDLTSYDSKHLIQHLRTGPLHQPYYYDSKINCAIITFESIMDGLFTSLNAANNPVTSVAAEKQ